MFIDWFTFGAQIFNFILLVWLLKRFLYAPVLQAIDEREKNLAARFDEAAEARGEADRERDEYRRKSGEIESRRLELIAAAEKEAEELRRRLTEEARAEAETLKARLAESIEKEKSAIVRALTEGIAAEVGAASRKALLDLAGTALEDRMVEVFIEKLSRMEAGDKEKLAAALGNLKAPPKLRCAFELTAKKRESLENAFKTIAGPDAAAIKFETEPALICGVELTAGGYRLSWSASDYLDSLGVAAARIISAASGAAGEKDPDESKA